MGTNKIKQSVLNGCYDTQLCALYGENNLTAQRDRYAFLVSEYEKIFGEISGEAAFFSAPGRTELGGNHTDHQGGNILAASGDLGIAAVVVPNTSRVIQVQSKGFPLDTVSLDDLAIRPSEYNQASALIRGIAARFTEMGYPVGGFCAYTTSSVLKGSGLSSSAAFEVLIGTIMNNLFCNGEQDAVSIAQIGQYAENYYFGKPSGLMDQMASSVGATVAVDFNDRHNPVVRRVEYDFSSSGYALCIIDTGGNHADLTGEYASIPQECKQVASFFGEEILAHVKEQAFYAHLAELRTKVGDRAILRAHHFFGETRRASAMAAALQESNFEKFLHLMRESGQSSFMFLQNVYASSAPQEQGLSLALALCDKILGSKGAFRVHGGGFAGTVQAFVPDYMLSEFQHEIERVFGTGSCHTVSIRPYGGIRLQGQNQE